MSFQLTVTMLGIVALILALTYIGVSLTSKRKEKWPPFVGSCPDYWLESTKHKGHCINTHSLGKCNLPNGLPNGEDNDNKNGMDFTAAPFQGFNGTCAKYKWAKACGVTWDGITTGISNPCS